jgi:4-hydroxy-3-polyprenylbenzoate decarboxylase
VRALGPTFLVVRLADGCEDLQTLWETLRRNEITRQYLFHVAVSGDVPLDDPVMLLWGWFTRFDPDADLHPAGRRIQGNRLLFDFPIAIDARWKKGYPRPVAFDPAVEKRVNDRWAEYGIKADGRRR